MPAAARQITVVQVTNEGQDVQITGLEETIMRVLDEEMGKVAELARQYAPEGKKVAGGGGHSPSGGQALKSSIHTVAAKIEDEDFISAGVASTSGHAPPVEYGSGIFNTAKFRSRSERYKSGRPYTAGRPNLRVAPGGEFRVNAVHARALAIPLPFKTPPDGRIGADEIYKRSHDKHGRPYVNAQGQPIMFSMWADNPGQEAQPFIRRAMNQRRAGINSRLRSAIAKGTHFKYKDIRVVMEIGIPM
jgi:hypothetical protein